MTKLIIEIREDGKVYATGPLHDKNLCIAMLEEAKNIVNSYQKKNIVMPNINEIKKILK